MIQCRASLYERGTKKKLFSCVSEIGRSSLRREAGPKRRTGCGIARPTCADEAGAAAVDQVVVVGQDERTALLDLQAVLAAWHLLFAGPPDGGEKLSAQPGLVGHLRRKRRRTLTA